jgi:2'-5' RNA ligase
MQVQEPARAFFHATWQRFQARPALTDHWTAWGPWQEGATYLTYLVPMSSVGGLRDGLHAIHRALAAASLAVVPPAWLHLTVQGVGFADTLSAAHRQALVHEAARVMRAAPAFRVRLGGANSFPDVAILEVYDDGHIRALRHRLRTAVPWLAEGGRDPLVQDGVDRFMPHLSLAYYHAGVERRAVSEALAPFRDAELGAVRVTAVQLVEVPKPSAYYRWSVAATLPLASSTSRDG